jgi:flagellar basal body rod protein FlgG
VIETIATNDLLETGSADVVVVVDQVPDVLMHVDSLAGSTAPGNGGKWDAIVTATIVDADGNPVADATVSGVWSNGQTTSCTTGADGMCTVSITNNKKVLEMTFVVTDVTHATFFYDPDANVVTEVTLYKP